MSVELSYLAMFGAFAMLLLVVQATLSMLQHGIPGLAGNRDDLVNTGMAGRADRALNNTMVALALIAPAAILVHIAGVSGSATEMAIRVFLGARIAYAVVYILGIPYLRTAAWLAGFVCTAILYLALL